MRSIRKFSKLSIVSLRSLLEKGIDPELAETIITNQVLLKANDEAAKANVEVAKANVEAAKANVEAAKAKDEVHKKSIIILKSEFEIENLKSKKKEIELKLLHSQSLLTSRNLIEKMESHIGRPNKSRSDRWVSFLEDREGTALVDLFRKCFENLAIKYSPEAAAGQIQSLYACLSSKVHSYDTERFGNKTFYISVPSNVSALQMCILEAIITSPDALGYENIILKYFVPEDDEIK